MPIYNLFHFFLSHLCQVQMLVNENVFIQGRCVHAGKRLTKHVTLFRMLLPPSIQTRGLSWKCNTLAEGGGAAKWKPSMNEFSVKLNSHRHYVTAIC